MCFATLVVVSGWRSGCDLDSLYLTAIPRHLLVRGFRFKIVRCSILVLSHEEFACAGSNMEERYPQWESRH
ncbi:uncharacterized protein LY89DRAFT_691844 [Mollisia scopiformis]|uniref:Uncharacterized protein n=1 Tax=Mollisia scopiformis TaxID=149040 RepID=A0A132B4Q8_MOLSC|nr:uncharacterized protein LY89DRAFT_691844 [Mollisia scopiformis]KUJ07395.1 hypothetical protein LY89DRAFT_691844 [Mollisia scopiformis]